MTEGTPTSTYRLQLNAGTTFEGAAALADYLDRLGVGALYASPVLQATPGSTHGYDVVDPTQASEALGGADGRAALSTRLGQRGLGLVLDIVPNHMGVGDAQANAWWWDVLQHGEKSQYAHYFDIEYSQGPLLVPVLDGEDALDGLAVRDDCLVHGSMRFPIAPGTGEGTPREVHERQHYRLVDWRRAAGELNYRRFFDINELAAVRVEDEEVFQATHGEVLRWVADGQVTGLRVDHPDGLTDPGGYLRRLRAAAPEAWLVVEKILGVDEALPTTWPVDGTTGYDALREICGVFVDPAGEPVFTRLAAELGVSVQVHEVERGCRRRAAGTILAAEVRRIARLVPEFEPARAEAGIAELLSSFRVYRSYLPEGRGPLCAALASASMARPDLSDVISLVGQRMLTDPTCELARRVQQTSGMVMAKGVEDTAFYRCTRFAALNEVGGALDRFGVSVAELHFRNAARAAGWPGTMTTLSTHDTKRSEDVRARLAVLAEVRDEFAGAVRRWTDRAGLPEPALNLLAWQTLVGAWPISPERLRDYLAKAAKEAKIATSWNEPDAEFDAVVAAWPERVFADEALASDVGAFAEAVRAHGWSNSLGQKLVQLAGPGVPDVYQGTELWDFSLVDPDNRRPVDYDLRRALLTRIDEGWLPPVDEEGAAKLLVTAKTLRLRRERPELFTGYRPLDAEGPSAEHAFAFARGPKLDLVAVATRLPVGLGSSGGWRSTVLPLPGEGTWTDVLTGRGFGQFPRLAELLSPYPVALLVRS
ncbi:(1-_4)-alpha-D-glucan 1-alpha-D-glucosylmutase [Crossiella equi]|uniref:(1->4)-alpha-D-glucan 1-alpha-D-glucosylmutase n=1 Tax=Crossiella equi TaxID=130796 RepID=A0ABS5A9G2_9PSEU|nr:malto-oligosyltrehalose synthase [Crossiella equi]MBP2473218.1 (1->4)-alpha-D-glucan 1-alpha-D-glucosylmutase [Crossiella equi]